MDGNQKETTENVLEKVEEIILSYGIQIYKKTTGCIKYTFIKEFPKDDLP